MREDQLERFGEAVEEKKKEAKARSEQPGEPHPHGSAVAGDQPGPTTDPTREQDERSPRAKNSGKGKKTADKWNQ
jgi:hypothetical protein